MNVAEQTGSQINSKDRQLGRKLDNVNIESYGTKLLIPLQRTRLLFICCFFCTCVNYTLVSTVFWICSLLADVFTLRPSYKVVVAGSCGICMSTCAHEDGDGNSSNRPEGRGRASDRGAEQSENNTIR